MAKKNKRKEAEKMAGELKARIDKAQEIALEYFDYLIETTPTPDYVQIVGSVGGDISTYQIYDDGSVYAKQVCI